MRPEDAGVAFDWEDLRARLAEAALGASEGRRHSPEQARAIMDERARALARIPARPPAAAEVLEVVTFVLGDEVYALETRLVRRVMPSTPPTPIPGATGLLSGLINIRGELLPVFDLRGLLGASARAATERSRIFVLGGERDDLGILVDEARGVLTLRLDQVLDPAPSSAAAGRHHLRGVTADALILIDGDSLLRDPRLVIDQGDD